MIWLYDLVYCLSCADPSWKPHQTTHIKRWQRSLNSAQIGSQEILWCRQWWRQLVDDTWFKISARYRWQIGIKSEDFHEYEQTRVVTTKQHMLACEELAGSTAAVSCQCDSWSTSILNNEYLTNAVWLFMVPMYIGIQMFCFWKC